jgi:hypothetical protein
MNFEPEPEPGEAETKAQRDYRADARHADEGAWEVVCAAAAKRRATDREMAAIEPFPLP